MIFLFFLMVLCFSSLFWRTVGCTHLEPRASKRGSHFARRRSSETAKKAAEAMVRQGTPGIEVEPYKAFANAWKRFWKLSG